MRKPFVLTLALMLMYAATASALTMVEGVVQSVDTAQKRIQIRTETGMTQWIDYADRTTLPTEAQNPVDLEGKRVRITLDANEGQAQVIEDTGAMPVSNEAIDDRTGRAEKAGGDQATAEDMTKGGVINNSDAAPVRY